MDQDHLVKNLESLTEQMQDPRVEQVLTEILDAYFSEEVREW